jgi:YidC/Oxa1 family membrane protein insertase
VFDRAGVESFLNADLFGAKLGNWVSQPAAELAAFGTDRPHMIAVGIPLMLIAGLATYLSMRASLSRQTVTGGQLAAVSKVLMYLAPVGMLVSGSFFPVPIGVLLYFLANNIWTFGQQHLLTGIVDREEDKAKPVKPKAVTPRPGQKPKRR